MKKALLSLFVSLTFFSIMNVQGLLFPYPTNDVSVTHSFTNVISLGFTFDYFNQVVYYGNFYPDGDMFFYNSGPTQIGKFCVYYVPLSSGTTFWYRTTTASSDLTIANNALQTLSSGLFSGFQATTVFVISWNSYYNSGSTLNIYQFAIATDGYFTFAILNYQQCSAAYSCAEMVFPNNTILNLTPSTTFSNVNMPGTIIYRVDGKTVTDLLLSYGPGFGDSTVTSFADNIPLDFTFNYFTVWFTFISYFPNGDIWIRNSDHSVARRILPYWIVDSVQLSYSKMSNRSVTSTSELNSISSLVTQASSLYAGFEATMAYSLSWYMRYANMPNIFQFIVTTNGTTSFMIFGYSILTSPATIVGYFYPNATLQNTSYTTTGTNCGKPGHYVYRVDSGTNMMLPFRFGDTLVTANTDITIGFCFNFYGVFINSGTLARTGQFAAKNGSLNVGYMSPFLESGMTKANMFYRQVTSSSDFAIINTKVAQFNSAYSGFSATNAHVTTWSQFVNFKQNVFQLIMATDGNNSFLLFSYGLISTTGQGSSVTTRNGTVVPFSPTMYTSNIGSAGQFILKVDSPPLTVKITNSYQSSSSPLAVNRSSTMPFNQVTTFLCPCSYTTVYEWTVYSYDAVLDAPISQITFSLNPSLTMATFVLPANTLDYGLYLIKLTVSVSVDGITTNQFTSEDYTFVEIVPTGITVMAIQNSQTTVTIGSLQAYVLDPVSYSVDLDEVVTISSLTFKYYCRLVSNTSTGSNYVLSGGATDLATGITTNTCFSSASGYTINTSDKTLTINSGGMVYEDGKVNQFVVSTTSNGYTYYQVVVINLNLQIPELPVLSISCLVPAFCVSFGSYKIFSPSNILTMLGSYSGAESSITSSTYSWQVYKNQGNTSNPIWTSLTTAEEANLESASTNEMTISSNLFTGSSIQQFKVEFTLSATSAVPALNTDFSASIILQKNQLPYAGQCSVDLTSGLALDTYFTITCQNWADYDGIVVKYEFFASTSSSQAVNLGNNQTGFFYTQFPTGASDDSNRLYIFVQIFDNSGGITRYNISTPITVTMSQATMTSSISELLTGSTSSPLVQMITGSTDLSVASSAIIAFSSSFNQVISGVDLTSNDSTQLVSQAKEINQKMVDAIKTFDLTDMSSIKAASSALSVVSATPALVSPDTATEVVNMCSEMTQNMITSGAKFGLSYVYQAASFILDASANCVQTLNLNADESALKTAATKQIGLIDTITSITSKQLAVGGSTSVTKDNINLTISRSNMNNVYTSVQTNGITMEFSNPCAIVGKSAGSCSDQFAIQQIFSRSSSLSLNSNLDTSKSSSLSVSYYNPDMSELSVSTDSSEGFYFWIPLSADGLSFQAIEVDNATISSKNQLYTLKADLTTPNMSVIFELSPSDTTSTGYVVALSYGQLPIISSAQKVYDSVHVFCPSDIKSESGDQFYKLFSSSLENKNSKSFVGLGIRELIPAEFADYCTSGTLNSSNVPILPDSYTFNTAFSSPVTYLAFGTGCYYIQEPAMKYSSWGVETLSDSNTTHVHCLGTHLTEFAGSMSSIVVLPEPIDFNNVWSKADFTQNLTIYLTVIIVTCLYILLFVWCRYMDWKDNKKRMIYLLADNNPTDTYFYEMLVYTGGRRDAGTASNVSFILSGQNGESGIRSLKPESTQGNKILQRGSVNSFIFSQSHPLGPLSYLRVWHDNSGWGRKASWFLKFVIVHDLQNRDKFYFICNDWLGVDKSDGLIDRILFLATKREKTDLSYLMEKQTKEKLSDGHLWFSIVARPPQSSFSRTDRLTCAFVLLCLTMLMNIMYYGMGSSSSNTNQIVLGPFSLSQTQIIIGVITNLIIFPPSFLVMQIFRKSRRRKTRSYKLQQNIKQALSDEMEIESATIDNVPKEKPRQIGKKKKGRKPFTLPWWFKIIGYVISFCIVVVCLFFIILRGISFGDETSRQWLTSFLISVLTSVCFTQPLQVILLSIFFVLLFRKANDEQDLEPDHEDNGRAINKYYRGQTVMRNDENENDSGSSFKREFDSDNPSQLADARKKRAMENQAWEVMRMILVYAIFLTVLFQVAYSKTSPLSYGYQTRLQSLLVPNITLVKTADDMWYWLKNDFMTPMIGTAWYNGESTSFDGFIKDFSSYLVGKVMLRQARVKSDGCSNDLTKRSVCYPDYGAGSFDYKDYGLGWATLSTSQTTPPSQQVHEAFQYSSALSIDSQPYAGLYKTYYGGGYVYQVNTTASNLTEIQAELASLQENNWIDQRSRALFVEFTLYNANVDLFAYCLILFEILPLGSIVITYEFNPMSLYTDQSAFIVAFDIIYMFFIVFFMLKEIKLIVKLKKKYLTNWWSYVNWILVAFSWVSFAMYMYRMYEKYTLMKKLKSSSSSSSSQVINFQTMQYWNSLMLMFLSFCCFVGSVKLLKVFSFSRHINMLVNVFHRVFKEMLSFMVMFLILVFAFTQMMYLMVYDRNSQFMSFATSLVTGFLMMLGKFNIDSFCQDAGPILGPITYSIFAVTVILILLNMFITLLTDSFSQIRREYNEQNPDEDSLLLAFFKSKILPSIQNAITFGSSSKKAAQSEKAQKYVESAQALETRTDYLMTTIKFQAKGNGQELKE